jgi:hypothetical protein
MTSSTLQQISLNRQNIFEVQTRNLFCSWNSEPNGTKSLYKIDQGKILQFNVSVRVSYPHHFNVDPDPDPAFNFNADPDPALYFSADHAPHQGDARSATTGQQTPPPGI